MTLKELDKKIAYKLKRYSDAFDKTNDELIIKEINMYANLRKSYVLKEPYEETKTS